MVTVLHPGHHGADTPCPGTAYDADTATYGPCPHPAHTPAPTLVEQLMVENEALRDAADRWRKVAALYQLVAREATNQGSDTTH
jgi:hypothetical protein